MTEQPVPPPDPPTCRICGQPAVRSLAIPGEPDYWFCQAHYDEASEKVARVILRQSRKERKAR